MKVEVKAKCVSCGHVFPVKAGEVKPGDMPTCPKCYSFGVAVSASAEVSP